MALLARRHGCVLVLLGRVDCKSRAYYVPFVCFFPFVHLFVVVFVGFVFGAIHMFILLKQVRVFVVFLLIFCVSFVATYLFCFHILISIFSPVRLFPKSNRN